MGTLDDAQWALAIRYEDADSQDDFLVWVHFIWIGQVGREAEYRKVVDATIDLGVKAGAVMHYGKNTNRCSSHLNYVAHQGLPSENVRVSNKLRSIFDPNCVFCNKWFN